MGHIAGVTRPFFFRQPFWEHVIQSVMTVMPRDILRAGTVHMSRGTVISRGKKFWQRQMSRWVRKFPIRSLQGVPGPFGGVTSWLLEGSNTDVRSAQ
jgi:hypothetical protein